MTGAADPGFADFANARILIVEDDYFIAMDLAEDLANHGATVIGPVRTVEEALAAIRQEPSPHWVVLDINLGGRLSFPVADALCERKIPFVFTTGYDERVIPPRFSDIPRHQKPTSLGALLRTFRQRPI